MVLQDTWLCTGTVRENIAYGKPDATEEEIIEAAKAAHADSFIRRLPKGYDTMITGGGGNLSAGQRQLLCIASNPGYERRKYYRAGESRRAAGSRRFLCESV